MKNICLIFLFLIFVIPVLARDFGTRGHLYQITEPDLLKHMMQKLVKIKENGKLQHYNQLLQDKAQKSVHRPFPVSGITHTQRQKEFFYDPSFRVPFELKDHKGRIFQKKGTHINPLTYQALNQSLIFIDGNDEAQIVWADKVYRENRQKAKVILTAGEPFKLMESWDRPVYFDQAGQLTKKLGIKHAPAIVKQEGLRLKITEVDLRGEKS
ncbi:MAG: type-F conjugative transfer system protein TraW [Alphaproteobacteria bacterium 16-39-46]|nr:MAG: type-F conjugative transfer system protein TraW [Alphaproteobacteria bacterium 16-39-46]OZA41830.1 MAG: type-F conjugative transfer system protein TraW [Alphaproteobacteria bacterium 17-39-52]HQS84688.1 type-F conjugative transfer system protein TraW [Alphaproteobacteria bacterium]HQS93107.1 type-F conjugative transfer system protein TraW [Alphaproteobacteria bacterium]